jgi:hypothetical protein
MTMFGAWLVFMAPASPAGILPDRGPRRWSSSQSATNPVINARCARRCPGSPQMVAHSGELDGAIAQAAAGNVTAWVDAVCGQIGCLDWPIVGSDVNPGCILRMFGRRDPAHEGEGEMPS